MSRAFLVPYALGRCQDDEAEAFEAHLLGCEACFQDLKVLDRAAVLMHAFADSESPALERLRGRPPRRM